MKVRVTMAFNTDKYGFFMFGSDMAHHVACVTILCIFDSGVNEVTQRLVLM